MEKRLGIRYTTHLINGHRHHNGFDAVCKSTFHLEFLRIQPKRQEYRKFNRLLIMMASGKKQDRSKQNNG